VGVGGMVLVLALGVFLPMWEMVAKVSRATDAPSPGVIRKRLRDSDARHL